MALLLFLAVIASAQACAPTTTNAPIQPSTGAAGRKRAVEQVLVTVVTNQKFDPSLNDSHLKTMRALLDDYAKTKRVVYNKNLVRDTVRNAGGRFAVVYTVQNADCDSVSDFARGAKNQASFIKRMRVKCQDRPGFAIN